jgi:hypothetical protein
VDLNDQIHMVDLENYQNTVCDETWRVISELANEVKDRKLRISFFNSTPQGGGGKELFSSIVSVRMFVSNSKLSSRALF